MKQIGSKIAILIIVIAMVFLASLLFEATSPPLRVTDEGLIEPVTYEDEMKRDKLASSSLVFETFVQSESTYQGEFSPIDYSGFPLARNFESIIDSTYEVVGVNYANQYSIISWSCGAECQSSIIVDVTSGKIIEYGLISARGLSFSPTSKLLVINPKDLALSDKSIATDYYLISESGDLSLIAKEINGENLINGCLHATTTAKNKVTNEEMEFSSVCRVPYGWEIISL